MIRFHPEAAGPRPGHIHSRKDFADELTALREQAGLTVRQVAGMVGMQGAPSTSGDWFAGRGLPSPSSRDLFVKVLTVCGVCEPGQVQQWLDAWRRVRRVRGPPRWRRALLLQRQLGDRVSASSVVAQAGLVLASTAPDRPGPDPFWSIGVSQDQRNE